MSIARNTIDYEVALTSTRDKNRSWEKSRDRLLGEVWPEVNPSFQLQAGAKIFTIGSCFARNIEEHLQMLGFKIPMLDFSVPREEYRGAPVGILNKYTPPAIFQEIEWAKGIYVNGNKIKEADSEPFLYKCGDGLCIDTNLARFYPVTRERFFQRRSQIYDTFKEAFSADCVVITLGLIEAWFDREKGVYIQEFPMGKHFAQSASRFGFERLTYLQCRQFVQNAIDAIRDINKDVKFLITTSPVPLARTFSDDDVIVANMYSKSVLRAVAGDVAASNRYVDYFPSYESVTLTKSWEIWREDLLHVTSGFVGKVMSRLVESYCSGIDEGQRLFQRSYVEMRVKAFDGALEFARQAVEKSPDHGELRKHFGNLLARQGDLKEAEAQFAKGISLNPGDPALHHQLSDVLARQGRLKEAVEAALRSTALAPENEEFQRHLGQLWTRKWNPARAGIHLALAAGLRRRKRTRRRWVKEFFRFSLPLLQRVSRISYSNTHPLVTAGK